MISQAQQFREEISIEIEKMMQKSSEPINLTTNDISFDKETITQINSTLSKLIILFNRRGNNEAYKLATQYLLLLRQRLTSEDLKLRVAVETPEHQLQKKQDISMTDSNFLNALTATKKSINYSLNILNIGETNEIESSIWQQLMKFGTPHSNEEFKDKPSISILNSKNLKIALYQKQKKDTWVFRAKNKKGLSWNPGWYTAMQTTTKELNSSLRFYNRGWLFQWLENYVMNNSNNLNKLDNRIKNATHPISTFLKMVNAQQDTRSFLSGGDIDVYQVKIDNKKLLSRHQCKEAVILLQQAFTLLSEQKPGSGLIIREILTNNNTRQDIHEFLLKTLSFI